VTPMTIMAATAKSKYAIGRSSSSATIWLSLTSLCPCAQISRPKTSTSISLKQLRLGCQVQL
jgi:hypothetical protein